MDNDNNILALIKESEPLAVSYEEGKTSYVVRCSDGTTVCLNKRQIQPQEQQLTCFSCNKQIILKRPSPKHKWQRYNLDGTDHVEEFAVKKAGHEHKGRVWECWDCGISFCRSCASSNADFEDSYCGF